MRQVDRRTFVQLAGAAVIAPTGLTLALPGSRPDRSARWPGYAEALVVDALAGPLQFNIPQSELPLSGTDLANVRASGITALNLTVGVVGATAKEPFEGTVARISAWEMEIDRSPDLLRRVRRSADIADAKATGRLGIIYGLQDAVPFQDRLERITLFKGLGVRIIQLTYNDRNLLGSGALAASDEGLTGAGRESVERMNAEGILVDLSHCGTRTTLDGIRASVGPVAFTHTGCAALFTHPRNKDDATLRLTAQRGGVVGIYLMPFLSAAGEATAADVVRHIEHALNICGEDHVGIGSDQGITPLNVADPFPQQFAAVAARRQSMGIAAPREDTPPYVPDLNVPRRMELIADRLAARGHPDRVIAKVLGGNFTRLFAEVWR